jgi:hypothetical protein
MAYVRFAARYGRNLSLAAFVLAAIAVISGACGDVDSKADDVEASVRRTVDAWNRNDSDTVLSSFTDQGLQELFNIQSEAQVRELMRIIQLTARSFSDTTVAGGAATTEVPLFFGQLGAPVRFSLVRDGAVWKIDGREFVRQDVPDGTTDIDLELQDFAFGFDADEAKDGSIAFNVSNTSEQDHEIVLASIPADGEIDIQEMFFSSEGPGRGVAEVGSLGIIEPAVETNLLFKEALSAGRYLLVCFLPDENDPEGTPRALKGMYTEFTTD